MARDYRPPGTGVGLKPKKPKKPPRPKPDAHDHPGPSTPAPAPPPSPPRIQDAHDRHPPAAPDPGIVARQRRLRAAGYNVAVDGVWGPQSQAAWASFTSGRPGSAVADNGAAIEAARSRQAELARQSRLRTQQRAEQRRLHALAAIENARRLAAEGHRRAIDAAHDREISRLRGHGLAEGTTIEGPRLLEEKRRLTRLAVRQVRLDAEKFAAAARKKAPEKLTSRELLALTVDPITGSFAHRMPNRRETLLVQRWLKSHGHANIAVDGIFGKQTGEAFLDAYHRFKAAEQKRRTEALVDAVYESGVVKPGEKDFPMIGTAPKPGQLLTILRAGGFTAQVIFKDLTEKMFTPEARWLFLRHKLLLDLERGHLVGGKRNPATGVYGLVRPVSFVDDSDESRLWRLLLANPTMSARDDQLRDTYHEQITALAESKTAGEFQRRIEQINYLDEKAYREFQQGRASEDISWWGKGLDLLGKPAEWSARQVTATALAFRDMSARLAGGAPREGIAGAFAGDVGLLDRRPVTEQADVFLETLRKEHPWVHMAFLMAVDPLWFVPGADVVAPFRLTARSAVAMERVGYRVAASGHLFPVASFQPLAVRFTHTLGGALIAPADAARQLGHVGELIADTPAARRVATGVHKATRSIHESIGVARFNTSLQLRHGFNSFRSRSGFEIEAPGLKTHEMQALADGSANFEIVADKMLKPILDDLHVTVSSLHADDAMRNHSWLGGAMLARVIDGVRVNLVQGAALDSAKSAFRAVYQAAKENEVEMSRQQLYFEARQAAREEYKRMIDGSASYIVGNATPEIAEALGPRLTLALDQLINVVMPTMQRRLIDRAEQAGLELFDDAGRFLGRDDGASQLLRAVAREAFTDSSRTFRIRNPLHNMVVSRDEMLGYVNNEVEVAARRLRSYNARRRANGDTPWSEDTLAKKIDAERTTIRGHWQEIRPNAWTDTREFLEIPDLYARQYAQLYTDALRGTNPLLSAADVPEELREIVSIAEKPIEAAGGEVESTIELLSWALSGRNPIHENDFDFGDAIRGVAKDAPNNKLVTDFRDTLDAYWQVAMDAYDVSLPRNLRKEWAYWRAMKEAQTLPMKSLYFGMQGWLTLWTTAALPLRAFGFLIRNVMDNTVKALIHSHGDPRVLMFGGEHPGSIFDVDLRFMRWLLSAGGRTTGNPAVVYFEKIRASLWGHSTDRLKAIFESHGVPIDEEVLNSMKMAQLVQTEHVPKPLRSIDAAETKRRNVFQFLHDGVWEIMAGRPESYAKRALYRTTYYSAIRDGKDVWTAMDEAVTAVDEVLFDYSKYSTIEDGLRFVFPFIYYWRRTTQFWVTQSLDKPWLPAEFALFEDRLRNDVHADWPDWMRRYVHANEVADVLGRVPGLGWLAGALSSSDLMGDPANFLSFNVLYRTFKGENMNLPADKAGIRFLSDFVDAVNDFGLSMNPAIRKPLELAGVFNYRAWQSVFPQTGLLQAFTQKYLSERFPNGLNIEAWATDKLFELIGEGPIATERIAENFDYYVQIEMSSQAARGEPISRAKAEDKIRDYFFVQTLVGYFGGLYTRRMDPTQFYLYKLQEQVAKEELNYLGLSKEDQRAYQLFKRKRYSQAEFDAYLQMLPMIEAYYGAADQGGYQAAERFKQQHPEVLPYVDGMWKGESPYSNASVRDATLMADTEAAFRLFKLMDDIDIADDVRDAATSLLVTDDLRDFWARNDTPKELRDRMMRGLFFNHVEGLNKTYHAIPENDFDARSGFLSAHPILVHWWQRNENGSDDLKDILNGVNATLREEYFNLVKTSGWDAAAELLKQFPFMFEFTKAAGRVTPDGEWKSSGGSGRHGRSQKARDYLAAKPYLDYYFSLPVESRSAWLNGDSKGARMVRLFFSRYAHPRGMTAHARDYLAVKSQLSFYFSLGKSERRAWLDGGSRGAMAVKAYFKKYGHFNKTARRWGKLSGSADPEINRRLQFWKRFFSLTPDQRPEFVHKHAAEYGIFVYGAFGEEDREQKERRYLREAIGRGLTPKAAAYLRVAPLLDLFFNIKDKSLKRLFLRANPEVQEYLDKYSHSKLSGDAKTDDLIEQYFRLPPGSDDRSSFLQQHPEVQKYFNSKASKSERALYAVLEVYFSIPVGPARKEFTAKHPEISEYFERRRREHENELMLAQMFDESDPRLAALRAQAQHDIVDAGQRKAYELALAGIRDVTPDTLTVRRERQPLDQ